MDDYSKFLLTGEQIGGRFALSTPQHSPIGAGGTHMSNLTGSSLEFRDHREYQPGDDPRRIDWNAYARTDKLILKLYREEVSPHVDLLIDGSRSMALESSLKLEATLGLSAVFAVAATNAGFSHGAWFVKESCRRLEGGSDRPSRWQVSQFDYNGDVAESLTRRGAGWRRRGIRLLVSDLLWLSDPLLTLRSLSKDASAVIVVQVLAAADVRPPERGNLRLIDSETEAIREIFVDAIAEERYKLALNNHINNWTQACRQVGAHLVTVVAEQILANWQLDELVSAQILRVH
jgi:uncharacterized protein (DUF58 family)